MKPIAAAFAPLVLAALATGCTTTFGSKTTSASGDLTTIVLDDRLPTALEDIWETCHDDFVILSGDTSVSLTGSCTAYGQLPTFESQVLYLGLSAGGGLPLDIPDVLFAQRNVFADFEWPLQNCYVAADTEVHFSALGFDTLTARWVTRDGSPALKVRLGNPELPATDPGYAPVWRSTIATAFCPSPINQGIVRGKLDSSGVNNAFEYVRFRDLDASLFVVFGVEDGDLTADLEVEPSVLDMDLGIDFSKLPQEAEDSLSSLEDFVKDEMGGFLADQLRDLPEMVLDQIAATIPAGDTVCRVEVVNGTLEIKTGHADGYSPCISVQQSSTALGGVTNPATWP